MKTTVASVSMAMINRFTRVFRSIRAYHWVVIFLALAGAEIPGFAEEVGTSAVPYLVSKERQGWRFCNKCEVLFDNEATNRGACSAGGNHVAEGFRFRLPYDIKGTPVAQTDWRECKYCHAMFYNGYPQKGTCPAVPVVHNGVKGFGPHAADNSFRYVLTHDVASNATAQKDWRFCNKCSAMFFDGYPNNKGHCPTGGGHVAAGYNFVLAHPQ